MLLKPCIPNLLSLFRLGLALVIGGLIIIPAPLWVAQLLVAVGVVSDKLDGTLARYWKVESDLGKRLESVVDPTFTFFSGLYILVHTDLPHWVVWLALTLFAIGAGGRVLIKLTTGVFYYEKSQITRLAVGFTFLMLLLYLFSVPYREWFLWPYVIWATFGALNYYRMMIQFMVRRRHAA